MKYFRKIVGERIYLSPLSKQDSEQYCIWLNNLETGMKLSMQAANISLSAETDSIERLIKEGNHFAIIDGATDTLLGNVGFNTVNHRARNATLGIFIGNKDYHNKGYGTEAVKLILNYSFNVLNLNNIMLTVNEFNTGAIKCYEKCGFKYMGRRRECNIYGAKRYDTIYMDILANEFTEDINELLKASDLKL